MRSCGVLIQLEARHGLEQELETFLDAVRTKAQEELGTAAWYAWKCSRLEYGIFDMFAGDEERKAHLAGPIAQALREEADALLTHAPAIQNVDVLSSKLPPDGGEEAASKGLLLSLGAKAGRDEQLEDFLCSARAMVMQEPRTTAWFALRMAQGRYGIFDTFPDNGARFSHLTGHVPRELARHALSLLGAMPEMHMLDMVAQTAVHRRPPSMP